MRGWSQILMIGFHGTLVLLDNSLTNKLSVIIAENIVTGQYKQIYDLHYFIWLVGRNL